ncbi:MAG TPA: AI-2E family transporter, partial [Patescibacteria group bacterium]
MEVIPYVGPIISAIPGVILGFTISPFVGLMTLLLYWLVQQFENYVVVPQVMKKAVGLNPITVIVALLIGVKLGGAFGAILAVPIAAAIGVVVEDLMAEKKE